jgi:hypothetical protein
MTTPTTKIAPTHLAGSDTTRPLCGVKGKALAFAADPHHATCGRCLRVAQGQASKAAKADAKLTTETIVPAPVVRALLAAPAAGTAPMATVHPIAKAAKAKATKAPKAKAEPASKIMSPEEAIAAVPTKLLNPEYRFTATGRVYSITGTCPECGTAKRTIEPSDAFQVCRCVGCQKKAVAKRIAAYRKAKRAAAKRASK